MTSYIRLHFLVLVKPHGGNFTISIEQDKYNMSHGILYHCGNFYNDTYYEEVPKYCYPNLLLVLLWRRLDHISWSLGLFSKTTCWRKAWHKTIGRPWHSECSQPLGYSILSYVSTFMTTNSLKHHLAESPITYEGPWLHYMMLEVFWDDPWTLLLGPHNFMVTALGSCVKWP